MADCKGNLLISVAQEQAVWQKPGCSEAARRKWVSQRFY